MADKPVDSIRVGGVLYRKQPKTAQLQPMLQQYETDSEAARRSMKEASELVDRALTQAHKALLAESPQMAAKAVAILNTVVESAPKLAEEIKTTAQDLVEQANTIVGHKGMGGA